MKPIVQPPGRQVPSWSLLSKEGSIRYLDVTRELKFKETDWATKDFVNPFDLSEDVPNENDIVAFWGLARKLQISKQDMLVAVHFDDDEQFECYYWKRQA
jgi:hypothetical protein